MLLSCCYSWPPVIQSALLCLTAREAEEPGFDFVPDPTLLTMTCPLGCDPVYSGGALKPAADVNLGLPSCAVKLRWDLLLPPTSHPGHLLGCLGIVLQSLQAPTQCCSPGLSSCERPTAVSGSPGAKRPSGQLQQDHPVGEAGVGGGSGADAGGRV